MNYISDYFFEWMKFLEWNHLIGMHKYDAEIKTHGK